ncbi:MAG: fumarylacetoacetate hydrolase family protein [Veillonellaceae bacterium]|nr:fumarylacetoacetate hydrolase family protein [Veillonellaceae bacterium]
MKLASFTNKDGFTQWGIVNEEKQTILGAADLEEIYFTFLPETLNELIEKGDEGRLLLATALEKYKEMPENIAYPLSEVTINLPIEPRRNVICIGKNYNDHVNELGSKLNDSTQAPTQPIFFTKATNTVIPAQAFIPSHSGVTSEIDYEGELGIIIGKQASHIPINEAPDYVFGYTIINDVTARDLQKRHQQWFLGKSLDGFCPMGPYILLKEDKELRDFEIHTYVNDELRQAGDTSDMIFSVASMISTLSQGMTLEAGDIIATGTPAGVGMGFNPPKYLHSGDTVKITIEDIGTLTNTIK